MSSACYHFAVLRFTPDCAREEFVNVGLLWRWADSSGLNLLIPKDLTRVLGIEPEIIVSEMRFRLDCYAEHVKKSAGSASIEDMQRVMAEIAINDDGCPYSFSKIRAGCGDSRKQAIDFVLRRYLASQPEADVE